MKIRPVLLGLVCVTAMAQQPYINRTYTVVDGVVTQNNGLAAAYLATVPPLPAVFTTLGTGGSLVVECYDTNNVLGDTSYCAFNHGNTGNLLQKIPNDVDYHGAIQTVDITQPFRIRLDYHLNVPNNGSFAQAGIVFSDGTGFEIWDSYTENSTIGLDVDGIHFVETYGRTSVIWPSTFSGTAYVGFAGLAQFTQSPLYSSGLTPAASAKLSVVGYELISTSSTVPCYFDE